MTVPGWYALSKVWHTPDWRLKTAVPKPEPTASPKNAAQATANGSLAADAGALADRFAAQVAAYDASGQASAETAPFHSSS